MPLSNFTRPVTPYENNPLPNDHKFRTITGQDKRPVTAQEFEDECNAAVDRDNTLDKKIEDIQVGIIAGSDNPLNAGKFLTTDGAEDPTLSYKNVTNDNIDDGAISGLKITPLTIGTDQLDNGIITPDKVPNNSMPYSKMDFDEDDIPYVVINVPDGAILYSKLNIPDGTIPYLKINIPDNTIPGPKLINKSITQTQQGLLSIGTPELIDEAITLPKMAPGVIKSAATKADQIAGNSNTVYVNPAVQQFHPSALKFRAAFNGETVGTNPPLGGYNTTSVERREAGLYRIHFTVPFDDIYYSVSVLSSTAGTAARSYVISAQETTYFEFRIVDNAGTSVDTFNVHVMGFGTQ